MFKRLLVIFAIIASLELFNAAALGEGLVKMVQMAGIGLIALIILLQMVYNHDENFRMNFGWEISAIFVSLVLSVLMAYYGHGQVYSITIIAQRFMYFYLFYFALHRLKIPVTDLEKIIVFLGVVNALFYIMQFVAYPTVIFNVRISEDRGTIRIFLQGMSYLVLAYFFILNRLFSEFRLSRMMLLLLFFSIFILMGTRQLIFSMFMLTMLNVLFSNKVKSKILIFALVLLAAIPVFFMFQGIFMSLLDVSKSQSAGIEDDIRIRSATYFLTEFFPNRIAYLTGNGVDSANSAFGQMVQSYKDVYGYFQTDVGIVGDFSRFGTLFLIAVLSLIFRILKGKTGDGLVFIKYYYINILLTFFTGAGPFGQGDSIVVTCITLYFIDVYYHDKKVDESTDEETDSGETTESPAQPALIH